MYRILLLSNVLGACAQYYSTWYGVSRHALLSHAPSHECVTSILQATPGIRTIEARGDTSEAVRASFLLEYEMEGVEGSFRYHSLSRE
jgi:hypothetical protein